MSYMDVKTAADRWELTERRITTLCRDGRIAGAKKEGGLWLIPDDAEKPVDGRRNKFTRAMNATAKLPYLLVCPISRSWFLGTTMWIKP